MRALQSAGLSVSPNTVTNKRISRDLKTSLPLPSPPISPYPPQTPTAASPDMPKPHRISLHNLPSPMLPTTSNHASPSASSSTSPSPHTLIPASSFAPSPTSSASSSPHLSSRLSVTDFNHNFPSIDELDEIEGLKLPSAPILKSLTTGSSKYSFSDGFGENHSPTTYSPITPVKAFPILPMELAPRPSSTPIPTIDTFNSRPGSPYRSPLSPSVPRKPSNLSLNASSRSPLIPHSTPPEKREFPNSLFPRILHEYLGKTNFKVLILDVRPRNQFELGHIKSDTVVCIDPTVLERAK